MTQSPHLANRLDTTPGQGLPGSVLSTIGAAVSAPVMCDVLVRFGMRSGAAGSGPVDLGRVCLSPTPTRVPARRTDRSRHRSAQTKRASWHLSPVLLAIRLFNGLYRRLPSRHDLD
jgi:hypothetical protein